jgi:hypothetical protein
MNREKVVKQLYNLLEHCEDYEDPEDADNVWNDDVKALKKAIEIIGGERMKLEEVKTCELVEELKRREGVMAVTVEPHADSIVKVNGPAIVLVVID